MPIEAEGGNRHGKENRAGAEDGSTGAVQRGVADSKGFPVRNIQEKPGMDTESIRS